MNKKKPILSTTKKQTEDISRGFLKDKERPVVNSMQGLGGLKSGVDPKSKSTKKGKNK